jgi:RHS repeat-associated protein
LLCADPINAATGNTFEVETDYVAPANTHLELRRFFNSLGLNSVGFGLLWRSSYDRSLYSGPGSQLAQVTESNGRVDSFWLINGIWVGATDVPTVLTQVPASGPQTGWQAVTGEDTIENYNLAGRLTSLTSRGGLTTTLIYNASNQLTTVTGPFGQILTFSYDSSGHRTQATDPEGGLYSYAYDSNNNLISVTYPDGSIRQYVYENTNYPNALTGIIDEDGNRFATWTYDFLGRAISSQHAGGADLTTFVYTNGSTTVTNALGQQTVYQFTTLQTKPKITALNRLATVTTAAATEQFTYDGNGYLASSTDWNGNLTTYVNDLRGEPTTINAAVGTPQARTTTITYVSNFHLPSQIVTPGLTTNLAYDANGNVLTKTLIDTTTTSVPYVTNGTTRAWTYTWNNFLLASVLGPRTDVSELTSFVYDSTGVLSKQTNALGQITAVTQHTPGGLPLTIVDSDGVATILTYDARQRLLTSTLSTSAGPLITRFNYDLAGSLLTTTLPDGSALTNAYDAAHRLTSVTDLFGNSINYTLDALGDRTLVQVKNPSETVTQQHADVFDALGRVLQDIGGMGQTTVYTYDNNSNALAVTPPSPSGIITYAYDALNRLSTAKDPSPGGTTTTTYDAHDRVLTVEDANSHTTAYVYNGFGDTIQTVSPDSGTSVFHYDLDSNQTESVKAGPLTADTTYDALDRPLATTYPGHPKLSVARTYDQATGHGFGVGRLTSATDRVGSLSLTYDERGNVVQEARVVTGEGTLNTLTAFDAVSRVAAITYPSGTVVACQRDSMGRVTSVTAEPPGASSSSNVVTGVAYQPFGPESGLTFGNGVTGAYGYDLDYRPTTRVETGTAEIQGLAYAYYPNNSVQTITDAVTSANTQAFTYDALDRLTGAISGSGGYGTFGFTWDPVSNMKTQTLNGAKTTYTIATDSNRLKKEVIGSTTETLDSTAAGNMHTVTSGSTVLDTFKYNHADQLASATTTSTAAKYRYDLFGQRLEKLLSGSNPIVYEFSRTDGSLLSENDLHQGVTADYIYLNGRPIGEVNPTTGGLYFTHTDRLGTPQKLTSSTQAVAWSALYQPFGSTGISVTGTLTTQSLRLPGQQFDPETQLYHNGFRDYDPGFGRYVESDPIGLAGGVNTYVYVGGNPLKTIDPNGLFNPYKVAVGATEVAFGETQFVLGAGTVAASVVFEVTSGTLGTPVTYITGTIGAYQVYAGPKNILVGINELQAGGRGSWQDASPCDLLDLLDIVPAPVVKVLQFLGQLLSGNSASPSGLKYP